MNEPMDSGAESARVFGACALKVGGFLTNRAQYAVALITPDQCFIVANVQRIATPTPSSCVGSRTIARIVRRHERL